MSNKISLEAALTWGKSQLSCENTRLDAEVLLCELLDCSRAYLYAYGDELLDEPQLSQYQKWIRKRATGYPLAYIVGKKEFWSQEFIVNEAVLIPRPETETLVELILSRFPEQRALNVADFGTGSGAIACSIAIERPFWNIIAVDKSTEALAIAAENASRLNCNNVRCIQSDWGESLIQKFDVIVSNPPYLLEHDEFADEDLQFEPQSALISGCSGLECIETILKQAKSKLNPGGFLAFEHGFNQDKAVQKLMLDYGFERIETIEDLSHHPRVTCGILAI